MNYPHQESAYSNIVIKINIKNVFISPRIVGSSVFFFFFNIGNMNGIRDWCLVGKVVQASL